jgi:hypothetical protein
LLAQQWITERLGHNEKLTNSTGKRMVKLEEEEASEEI